MMEKDYRDYAKGYKECQRHGLIQHVPANELYSVIKPWSFRGWAINVISKIYLPYSKGHAFILIVSNYFTK